MQYLTSIFIGVGLAMDAVSFARIDQARTRQWHALARVFETYDALLCPTMALGPPDNDARDADFERVDADGRLHGLDMTALFNMVVMMAKFKIQQGSLLITIA